MTRRTATGVWGAMAVVPLAFAVVASRVAREAAAPELRDPLLWAAIAAAALNVVLAWRLPPRLGPARAVDPDAVAFTRVLVSLALCEAGAMAPIVAYMLTRDGRLLAVLGACLAALVPLFPSDRRWAALSPRPALVAPAPAAEVR